LRLILKQFNFRGEDLGSRVVGCCPISHDNGRTPNDNRTAFSWDFERQMWQCFTHRCHLVNGSDVFALVQSVLKCSFNQAIQWILGVIDKNLDEVKDLDPEEALKLQQIIQKRSELVRHKRMEDELLQHLEPSVYFKTRGFSDEVIQEFKCYGEWHKPGTYGEGRAMVPVYDPIDGYLIAFTGRLLDDSQIETWRPKWMHCLNYAERRKKSADRTDEERFHQSGS